MDLSKSLVYSVIKYGIKSYNSVLEKLPSIDYLTGEGRDHFEFIQSYYSNYEELPSASTILEDTGFGIDSDPLGLSDEEKENFPPVEYWIDKIIESNLNIALKQTLIKVAEPLNQNKTAKAYETIEEQLKILRELNTNNQEKSQTLDALKDISWKHYLDMKSGKRGILTPWQGMNDATLGWWPQDFVLFTARSGIGKCLASNTLITDPYTGMPDTIENFVENDKFTHINTWSKDKGIHTTKISRKLDTHYKNCFKVTLSTGRTITASKDHPFLTPEGWVKLKDLKVGGTTAVSNHTPEPMNTILIPEHEVDILAGMLSQGSSTGNHVSVSSNDCEFIKIMDKAAEKLGVNFKQRDKYTYAFTRKNPKDTNRVRDLLKKYKCDSLKSIDKFIPDIVYQLPNHLLARFIGIFFMADGYVDKSGVCLVLGSEKLINDFQRILLRLGIQSSVRYKKVKYNKGYKDSWRLRVYSAYDKLFLENCITWGDKRDRLIAFTKLNKNPNVGSPTISDELKSKLWDISKSKSGKTKGAYHTKVADYLGVKSFETKHMFGKFNSVTPKYFKAFCKIYGITTYDWWWNTDIFWDKITSIENVGNCKTYDFTIEPTSCFIANDLIVHNSWSAIMLAHHALKDGYKVLFTTTEMSRKAVALRLIALHLKLPYKSFREGKLDAFREQRLKEGLNDIPNPSNLHIIGGDFDFKTRSLEGAIRDINPDLIIIDGVYLLKTEGKDRTEKASNAFNEVKRLANRTNKPIIGTMQLNRESVKNKRGQKEINSGGLEHIALSDASAWNADVVYSMDRDEDMEHHNLMEMRCLKVREGAKNRRIRLNWNFDTMDFSEIPEDDSDFSIDKEVNNIIKGDSAEEDDIDPETVVF